MHLHSSYECSVLKTIALMPQ